MKRKTCKLKTLALLMAMGLSTNAMAQQKSGETDWTKDFTSRITLNGVIKTLTAKLPMLTT